MDRLARVSHQDRVAILVVWVVTVLYFMLFVSGCATMGADGGSSGQTIYELDLYGTLDGAAFDGLSVGSNARSHVIQIISKTDVNEMVIQSNGRYKHFPDVIQTGWFKQNRGFEYHYDEIPGIEDTGYSVLRLSAFSKQTKGDGSPVGAAFGLILFHNDKYQLPAENICNGADTPTVGASICQNRAGLIARLKFDSQVVSARAKADGSGPIPGQCVGTFIDANTFEYLLPLTECVIEFMQTSPPHARHVHLAYGHNRSAYRGDP